MNFSVIIPARYASTRLPGKPLVDIAGKPMIQHVYERALDSGAARICIATDDERICQAAKAFGAEAIMTSASHPSGTDRLAEAVSTLGIDDDHVVVNLQGDEPMMPAALIHQVAEDLYAQPQAAIATLCERIVTAAELFDPHVVKVVMDQAGNAIYFSRAVIPWDREAFSVTTEELPDNAEHYRHIGLYAYHAGFIRDYVQWPACALEQMESLEQLRVLWQGYKIHVTVATEHPGHAVDTEADLQLVVEAMKRR